jgi:tRNA nucleotidyltransferase (CCA-adding enzyme)
MKVPESVLHICSTLGRAGYEAWVVGGAVRDSLIGRDTHDWDIATNARPDHTKALFPQVIETGIKHGTVTVVLEHENCEVTTYRGDGVYLDGRHPESIAFVNSIEVDLARRDFTVNAIAYDPIMQRLIDPFGGQNDITNRCIKAVGDPFQRFSEDGLRVLRAIRFVSTLDFVIDGGTAAAIPSARAVYAKVSVERVQDELRKIMAAATPSRSFETMAATQILDVFTPELVPLIGCTQNRYHAYDVWHHTMMTLDGCPVGNTPLRMAALFHDVAKPDTKGMHPVTGDATFYNHETVGAEKAMSILTRLKFANNEKQRICHLIGHHLLRYETGWSDAAVRRWIRNVGNDNIADLCAFARADFAAKGPAKNQLDTRVIDELEARASELMRGGTVPLTTTKLAVRGEDIMQTLGIQPGPRVGKVLAMLLDAVTDAPELNNRESLLRLA